MTSRLPSVATKLSEKSNNSSTGQPPTRIASAGPAAQYLETERDRRTLEVLAKVAAEHDVEPASVALAWLAAQPTITAPISSARDVRQLQPLLTAATLRLTAAELRLLDAASRP
ncbi:aldo/keto reductase [Nonomuraea sp. NPDC050680]|uniref:aldo/keto reductase n=1 Tax=Nonomuraea sp. NPDC050680 TaxID=3154630 RepID=UPI0033EF9D3A